MMNFGLNRTSALPAAATAASAPAAGGCGGTTGGGPVVGGLQPNGTYVNPDGSIDYGFNAGGFGSMVATATPVVTGYAAASPYGGGERFVSSMSGGVVVGADGAPAGRVPEGSFIDTKDGSVYGPDGKQISLPQGATVDFFDLPDLAQLRGGGATAVAGVAGGGAAAAPMKTAAGGGGSAHDLPDPRAGIDGQWGPGGVTAFKGGGAAAPAKGSEVAGAHGGGAAAAEECDSEHGGSKVAGASGGGASAAPMKAMTATTGGGATAPVKGGGGSAVAGAYGAGAAQAIPAGYYPVGYAGGYNPATSGGGVATGVAGVNGLGTLPSLDASLRELVDTLRQLTQALQDSGVRGGGPAHASWFADRLPPRTAFEPSLPPTDLPPPTTTEATKSAPPPPATTPSSDSSTTTTTDSSTPATTTGSGAATQNTGSSTTSTTAASDDGATSTPAGTAVDVSV